MTQQSRNLKRGFRRLSVAVFVFWTAFMTIVVLNNDKGNGPSMQLATFLLWITVPPAILYLTYLLGRWVYRGFQSLER